MRTSMILAALATLAWPIGCADEATGCGVDSICDPPLRPQIELLHEGLTVFDGARLPMILTGAADELAATLTIRNHGDEPLRIEDIVVVPYGGDARVVMTSGEEPTFPFEVGGSWDERGPTQLELQLRVTPDDHEVMRVDLVIVSNSSPPVPRPNPLVALTFEAVDWKPVAVASPVVLDFPPVEVGGIGTIVVLLRNEGLEDLLWYGFELEGDPEFRLAAPAGTYAANDETAAGIAFNQPVVVAPGGSRAFHVRFAPTDGEPRSAELRLVTNDPVSQPFMSMFGITSWE